MELPFYKILAADLSSQELLLIDGINCSILAQMPYAKTLYPVTIAAKGNKVYIPANDEEKGQGVLLICNPTAKELYQLPVTLPLIKQFALNPNNNFAYLISNDSTLYQLDLTALCLIPWGAPGIQITAVGLAVTSTKLYTLWEENGCGALLSFTHQGKKLLEATFDAIPTSITPTSEEQLLITFTASKELGEGVLLFTDTGNEPTPPKIISTLCPHDMISHEHYPIHVIVSPDMLSAYLVNEDSASISILDLAQTAVTGHISLGRSISRLYLLSDRRFALASSSLFADLVLIDLVNGKILASTSGNHELYPELVLLPY